MAELFDPFGEALTGLSLLDQVLLAINVILSLQVCLRAGTAGGAPIQNRLQCSGKSSAPPVCSRLRTGETGCGHKRRGA
jgi:hypothetical protein